MEKRIYSFPGSIIPAIRCKSSSCRWQVSGLFASIRATISAIYSYGNIYRGSAGIKGYSFKKVLTFDHTLNKS
ncbi:MAG: hypothetical protein ABIT07_10125 [Ferruginibacter sp.]